MAEEEAKTEEGQVDGQTAEGTEATEDTPTTTETEAKTAPEPSKAEQKLTEQVNELQGKFDTLSQDASRSEQLLKEIQPFVNWDGMKASRAGGGETDELGEEGEQTFVTKQELQAHEKRIEQKIATSDFQRDFRTKYPDLGDKGPKEELVRFYYENKTLRTDSFDKRLEGAVKAARALLKSEQDKGKAGTEADKEKAAQEAKAKAEAAAKASGLSSAGITSPKESEGSKETETAAGYVAERKAKLEKLRTK